MTKAPITYGDPGDLEALKARLWDAVQTAHSLLRSRKPDMKLRAVHGVSQAANAYRALLETADLERRLKALELEVSGTDEEL